MTPFFPGSVTSDGNENCSTTSYQIGPNFGRAHDLHWSRGPNSAQWSPLGLTKVFAGMLPIVCKPATLLHNKKNQFFYLKKYLLFNYTTGNKNGLPLRS